MCFLIHQPHSLVFAFKCSKERRPQIRPVDWPDKRILQTSSIATPNTPVPRHKRDSDNTSIPRSYPTCVGREKITRVGPRKFIQGIGKSSRSRIFPLRRISVNHSKIGIICDVEGGFDYRVVSVFTVSLAMSVPKQLSRKHNLFDL
jgi:hypothetical protein